MPLAFVDAIININVALLVLLGQGEPYIQIVTTLMFRNFFGIDREAMAKFFNFRYTKRSLK